MFSIYCYSRVKSWRNRKRTAKNNKNSTIYNKHNWEGINLPSEKIDWEKTDNKKNVTIATNGLYAKKEKIYPAYVSKPNCEKQIILLMTPNREKWHYVAAKKYQHYSEEWHQTINLIFIVWIVFIPLEQKILNHIQTILNKLKSHKKVCENKHFHNVIMPSEDTKIFELNQYQKSDKAQFIECIIDDERWT